MQPRYYQTMLFIEISAFFFHFGFIQSLQFAALHHHNSDHLDKRAWGDLLGVAALLLVVLGVGAYFYAVPLFLLELLPAAALSFPLRLNNDESVCPSFPTSSSSKQGMPSPCSWAL